MIPVDTIKLKDEQNIGGGGGPTVSDPDAQAFVDAVGTLSQAQADAIDNLVIGLKANGTWSKHKAIYPFIGGTASAHKWNLKNPQDTDAAFRLTFFGTGTHSASGWQTVANNATDYAETHLLEDDVYDHHLSVYNGDNGVQNSDVVLGFNQTGGARVSLGIDILKTVARSPDFNGLAETSYSTNDTRGYHALSRLSTTSLRAFSITESKGESTNTYTVDETGQSPPTTSTYHIGKLGGSTSHADVLCQFASIGKGLTLSELRADSKTVEEYQDALGRGFIQTIYEPEYQDVLNEATALGYTLPSASEQTRQNAILSSLKSTGDWVLLDQFFWFAGDGSDGFKNINWVNPTGTKGQTLDGCTHSAAGLVFRGNASNNKYLPPQSVTNHNSSGSGITVGNMTGNHGSGDVQIGTTQGLSRFLMTASDGTFADRYWDVDIFVNRQGKGIDGMSFNGTVVQHYRDGATLGGSSSTGLNTANNITDGGTFYLGSTGNFDWDGVISFFAIGGNYNQTNMYNAVQNGFWEPEYQAVLTEGAANDYVLPSYAEQESQNHKLAQLKTLGLWSGIDSFMYFKGSADKDFKLMDWKDPVNRKATESGAGITYSSTGVKGDNANYITVPWNPTDDGGMYSQSSAGWYWEQVTAPTSGNETLFSQDTAASGRVTQIRGNATFQYLNSNGTGSRDIVGFPNNSHYAFALNANTLESWKNGVSFDSVAVTPDSIPAQDWEIFRIGSTFFGDAEIGYALIGGYMNPADVYTALTS